MSPDNNLAQAIAYAVGMIMCIGTTVLAIYVPSLFVKRVQRKEAELRRKNVKIVYL